MKGTQDLEDVVIGLLDEYKRVKQLYDDAGIDVNIKEQALQGMANTLQLMNMAIQNYANWKHITREDIKSGINKKF
jgi:hypothetical protein